MFAEEKEKPRFILIFLFLEEMIYQQDQEYVACP